MKYQTISCRKIILVCLLGSIELMKKPRKTVTARFLWWRSEAIRHHHHHHHHATGLCHWACRQPITVMRTGICCCSRPSKTASCHSTTPPNNLPMSASWLWATNLNMSTNRCHIKCNTSCIAARSWLCPYLRTRLSLSSPNVVPTKSEAEHSMEEYIVKRNFLSVHAWCNLYQQSCWFQ